jgi:hypothetical protein
MARKCFLSAVCVLLAAVSVVFGQTQTVVTKDGRRITGAVTLTDGVYKIRTKLAEVIVPALQVETVISEMPPQQEYQQRRGQIDPNNAEDHVKLGCWALEKQLLEEARGEFQAALNVKPDHEMASLFLRQVERKLQEQPRAETRPAASQTRPAAEEGIEDAWLISEEDVNRIRVAEMGAESARTVAEFRDDVLDRFVQSQGGNKDFQDPVFEKHFRRMRPGEKLAYILKNMDPNTAGMMDDIVVRSDPKVLEEFRRVIWPLVARSCGTPTCHGGPSPVGGWKVFRAKARDERIEYTNFIILDGFVGRDGKSRMIDRSNPAQSLLLQYGLPPERAEMKHPVNVRQTVFASTVADTYRRVRDWIAMLRTPHPNYRLEYRPPMGMKLNFNYAGPGRTQPANERARED